MNVCLACGKQTAAKACPVPLCGAAAVSFPAFMATLGRRKEIADWLRLHRRALGLCKGQKWPGQWRENGKLAELQYIAAGPYFITKAGRRTRHLYIYAAPF